MTPRRLLDTSVIIENLRNNRWEEGFISVITLIEFTRGLPPGRREEAKRLLEEAHPVIGLDNKVILVYSELYNKLKEEGQPLGDAVLLIASTAKAHKLKLVTHDTGFQRLEPHGLALELRRKPAVPGKK